MTPNNNSLWQPDSDFDSSYDLLGQKMYEFAESIFPFPRSITGNGVRDTLTEIKKHLPDLTVHEVPTGTEFFDWKIPDEWNIRTAYIADLDGKKIIDFNKNNLHVMGYSEPIDTEISREQLDTHLYSIPELPDTIPYATSYYDRNWGFCLSQHQREQLTDTRYRVFIDAELSAGHLTYADLLIPGESDHEILISTYTCHPSLANNEISGPTLTTFLARMLSQKKNRFSYRIVFAPETIGAIVYMGQNLTHMKAKTLAGFILTCVGDDRSFSYMPSRSGRTIADRAAQRVLNKYTPNYRAYNFLKNRASDERQYCSPGADLPVVSVMRTAYGAYPEYHTSDDNMNIISASGFSKSFYLHQKIFEVIENQQYWQATNIGEPQLSRRNLRSSLGGQRFLPMETKTISDILALSDGLSDNNQIADETDQPVEIINKWADHLVKAGLLIEIGR